MEQSDGLRQRKAPGLEQEMAAAQWPQLGFTPDFGAKAIGPCAGGIDHAAGLDIERHAHDFVMEAGAVDFVRSERKRLGRDAIDGRAPRRSRFRQDPQNQARIVGLGVEIGPAALSIPSETERARPPAAIPRRASGGCGRRRRSRRPQFPGRGQNGRTCRPRAPAAGNRAASPGQARRAKVRCGRERFARQADVALGEIAQAAVHQFRRARGRPAGVVARLDEPDAQPRTRQFERDARAGYAPADNQRVERRADHPATARDCRTGSLQLLRQEIAGIEDARRIEMFDHCAERADAAFPLLSRQIPGMILADPMLVGDRATLAHDRFADRGFERAPARKARVEVWSDPEHEGRIDARTLRVDVREMGLGVACLAEPRHGVAAGGLDRLHRRPHPRPVDRRLHRVDRVTCRPQGVPEIGAPEAARAPFPAKQRSGRNRVMAAQHGGRLTLHGLDLRGASGEPGQEKDLVVAAAAQGKVAFEPVDRASAAREPQGCQGLGRVGEARHRQTDPRLGQFPRRRLARLPAGQEKAEERLPLRQRARPAPSRG